MWPRRRETSPEEKTHPENNFIDCPDGGRQAWLQVFVATLITMIVWGYPTSFGVYQLYYLDTLKLPSDIVPWIGSAQAFLAFALCTVSGIMADMGLVRLAMTFGCVLVVVGTLLTSTICGSDTSGLEKAWGLFLSQGIITGMGLGFCYMPPLSVANSYFSEQRRPFALAVAATGTGIGSIVFTLLVQYLTPVIGFEWTVRCQAFVVLAISVVAVVIVKPRLEPTIGSKSWDGEMFKDWPCRLFTCGACLFFFAIFFAFFCINGYARDVVNLSPTTANQMLLIATGLSILGRLLSGYVAQRFLGAIRTYSFATCILSILIFIWITVWTPDNMYAFSALIGFFTGAAQGLYGGALSSLTRDPSKFGIRVGMVSTIAAFFALAGPPVARAITHADSGRYTYAQVWAGLVLFLASMLLMAAGAKADGRGWKAWVLGRAE
ncbi:major facilitator superfamily domain-containing protein [Sordaria brevicollis]|uniref:Major facilitator superfamily domain-containing protein n=1 Tax=Sordaria brevicollis TaxID=83679 RepID=A0AAE0PNP3_SORBR|nr:major facilitator superfamily domain-containing protein [Sordaria brevicollis]